MFKSIKLSDFYAKPIEVSISMKELKRLCRYLRKYPDEARKLPEIDFSAIEFGGQNLFWEQITTERR